MTQLFPFVEIEGVRFWYLEGQLHRNDGPAVERPDGTKEWWRRGELHRDGAPAIEKADGGKMWWSHGQLMAEEAHGRRLQTAGTLGSWF